MNSSAYYQIYGGMFGGPTPNQTANLSYMASVFSALHNAVQIGDEPVVNAMMDVIFSRALVCGYIDEAVDNSSFINQATASLDYLDKAMKQNFDLEVLVITDDIKDVMVKSFDNGKKILEQHREDPGFRAIETELSKAEILYLAGLAVYQNEQNNLMEPFYQWLEENGIDGYDKALPPEEQSDEFMAQIPSGHERWYDEVIIRKHDEIEGRIQRFEDLNRDLAEAYHQKYKQAAETMVSPSM